MAKKKTKTPPKTHTEAKGLFLLSCSVLFLLAQFSYAHGSPGENWLGALGYFAALSSNYFFGLAGYLVTGYFFTNGAKLLVNKPAISRKSTFYYFSLIFCICMLFTILSESFPSKAHLFQARVYTENLTLLSPSPKTITRHNLGGVPAYYLYSDLPHFYFQKMLSPTGTSLIFSFGSLLSFLFLTGISLTSACKSLWQLFSYIFRSLFSSLKYLLRKTKDLLVRLFTYLREHKQETLPAFEEEDETILKKEDIPPPYRPKAVTKKIKLLKKPILKPVTSAGSQIKMTSSGKNKYRLPSPRLLNDPQPVDQSSLKRDLDRQAKVLEDTLQNFGIDARVVGISCGPTIISFEVQPPVGVKVQKIKALESDIALALEAKSVRILAPIPGKALVGVEVPSLQPQAVCFKELLQGYQKKQRKFHIPILLGKTVNGDCVISDLAKMPHCLIAGATGSGKSVCINTIVMSILMNARPDEIKMLMIDPKKVELTQYSNLPHMIAPVISEAHGAYAALQWLVREMNVRYEILKQLGLRNISAFNSRKAKRDYEESLSIPIPEHMPMIVAIVDEFADLMMVSSSDLETPIARIAQMARAVGIHLILATQRPSREVITGIIKANFPTRIAIKVSSRINSQIILDETGAESLLGNGDLLFLPPGSSNLVRAQGSYISDEEINTVVETICNEAPPNYLISSFDAMKKEEVEKAEGKDSLYDKALEVVVASKSASTTYLQRKLKIGYARAASLMDELEENGVVGPQEGSRPRKVFKSPESF